MIHLYVYALAMEAECMFIRTTDVHVHVFLMTKTNGLHIYLPDLSEVSVTIIGFHTEVFPHTSV